MVGPFGASNPSGVALRKGGAEMPMMQEGPLCAAAAYIKLTETREITPHRWVHPEEER